MEAPGVVDQHVEASEPLDRGLHGGGCGLGVGHVEGNCEQVIVPTQRLADAVGVAGGGHHGVSGSQCRPGDVDAQTSARAGHEPHVLFGHL